MEARVAALNIKQISTTTSAKTSRASLRANRLGLLFVGSALLHMVAAIALLRSWDFSGPAPIQQVVTQMESPAVEEVVQVVRLELAVAPASENAIIKLTKAESAVEESKEKTKADNIDAMELKPADGAEPASSKESKRKSTRPGRSARGAIG